MNEYLMKDDLQEEINIYVMINWERDWKRTWKWRIFRKEPSEKWIERYIDKVTLSFQNQRRLG
jgi:hypothetical protein